MAYLLFLRKNLAGIEIEDKNGAAHCVFERSRDQIERYRVLNRSRILPAILKSVKRFFILNDRIFSPDLTATGVT